jgi:hypothetical protein
MDLKIDGGLSPPKNDAVKLSQIVLRVNPNQQITAQRVAK